MLYVVICSGMERIHCKVGVDFALGGFRDSRETGPPSISAQQLKAELQEADSSDRELAMTLRNALHDTSDFQIQILASTLHAYLLLSRVQPSNFYVFLNSFLTSQDTFRVLKTLTASPAAAQALSLLGAATQRGNSALAKQVRN